MVVAVESLRGSCMEAPLRREANVSTVLSSLFRFQRERGMAESARVIRRSSPMSLTETEIEIEMLRTGSRVQE